MSVSADVATPRLPSHQTTVAVISAFRPSEDIASLISDLQSSVDHVIVVDDGSEGARAQVLDGLDAPGVDVIRLGRNRGIAEALNTGVERALELGATRVLTSDQDSRYPDGVVTALHRELDAALAAGVPAWASCPASFDGVPQKTRAQGGFDLAVVPIQSGCLIERSAFDTIGQFRSDLFIDLVDTEFDLRATVLGQVVVAAPDVDLPHALGTRQPLQIWGHPVSVGRWTRNTTLSSPFRYYYRVRNRIHLTRFYGRSMPGFLAVQAALDIAHFAEVLLFAEHPSRLLHLYARAALAGVRRRGGRIDSRSARLADSIRWRRGSA